MKKIIFSYILIFALIVSGFVYISICGKQPETSPSKTSINYVSLGDSIAEGYALDTYDTKDENGFVVGSYAHSFKTALENEYKTVNAINYAEDGDTSADLLSKLTELNGTELSTENQQMKTNIQNADIITICIGANDILTPAQSNLASYILLGTDISGPLNEGLNVFTANFPNIVNTLKTLNPNAELAFLNVYNPYKEFISTDKTVSIVTSTKFNAIGIMAESYINAINQVISTTLGTQDKCSVIEVKGCFDDYYNARKNDAEITEKYDIVNVNIFSTEDTISPTTILNYIDPHPSQLGHAQISTLLTNWYNSYFK